MDRPRDGAGTAGRRYGLTERRLLIFTEYEDTRRWVERLLREALAHTERADERQAQLARLPTVLN